MREMWTLAALEHRFPLIHWREPVHMVLPYGDGWACRVCIAQRGIRADELDRLYKTRAQFHLHFRGAHEAKR